MNKGPLLLAVGGIIVAVFMFQLPKSVVDDGDEVLVDNSTVNTPPSSSEAGTVNHSQPLPQELRPKIEALKADLMASENTGDFPKFADSLADVYFSAAWYDSAGHYAAIAAEANPGVETWTKAANYHYEAFSFAMDGLSQAAEAQLAAKYLNLVLEAEPSNLDIKAKLGMTYVVGENPMQGILLMRDVVEEDPTNVMALFNLGMLSRQSGQTEKAVERFEAVLEIEPDNLQAMFFLGVSYQEIGDQERARQTYEELLDMTTDPAIVETVEGMMSEME
ncbi:MAG TPA: peptidase [Cytophagales bacterium]|nr:peptidase [Cytophagales bacterium]HAP58623.1 peptidase [Cytophagales bacterium]